jgi:flagellar hook assembly protein FlgD
VFVIPNELPNGRVDITIAAAYALGKTATIPVTIVATRGSLTGPLTARIMASGVNEAHKPAEVLVRELAAVPIAVGANARGSTTLTWDTRDTKGDVVPADAYSLVIEVRSDDGGASRVLTAGATLELR